MSTGLLDLGEAETGAPRLEGVGVLRRGLARLIDLGVLQLAVVAGALHVVVAALILELVFGQAVWAALEKLFSDESGGWSRLWEAIVGFAAITVLHTLSEGLHGSTLGKRLCGITAVSEDGTPAGLLAALKRSLGFLVDQFVFGLVGAYRIHNDPKAQRVGDSWAGTMVVRIGDLEPSARRGTGRLVLATLAGLSAAAFTVFLGFTARLAHDARAVAGDRVEIIEVAPVPNQSLRRGEKAVFEVRVEHGLESSYEGRLALYVQDRDDLVPTGERILVRRGGSTTRLRGRVRIPPKPDAPGSYLIRFGVELFPAQNAESASAFGLYAIELAACDWADQDVLCVIQGRSG